MEVSGWAASCFSHFTPWERSLGSQWIGVPRLGLDVVVKRKIPAPARNLILVTQPTGTQYTD